MVELVPKDRIVIRHVALHSYYSNIPVLVVVVAAVVPVAVPVVVVVDEVVANNCNFIC